MDIWSLALNLLCQPLDALAFGFVSKFHSAQLYPFLFEVCKSGGDTAISSSLYLDIVQGEAMKACVGLTSHLSTAKCNTHRQGCSASK
jgi:hypothetical protein